MKNKISLSKVIIFFQLSAMVVFIFLVFNVRGLVDLRLEEQNSKFDMLQKADRLRQSSDDLTHFARTYVVTNKIEYKEQYLSTLKIRRGELPRPLNYDALYWDLDKESRDKRNSKQKSVSLNELMRQLPYTDKELALLKLSEKNSDELARLEIEAFKAMDEHNQNYAIELLHSQEYYSAKSKIMQPIDTFIINIGTRTGQIIENISNKIKFYQIVVFSLILFYMSTNISFYIYFNRQKKLIALKEKQLLSQSKLAQMGQMISMIAHQWRQPLGAIASTSIDLKLQIELDLYDLEDKSSRDACSKYFMKGLNNIEDYTQGLTKTIDDFRDFYKPDKGATLLGIERPIKRALSIVKTSLKTNNIVLIEKYKSKNKLLMFDGEIMQVLLNLFKNSEDNFKAKDLSEATIWITTEDTKDGVTLLICDNGGGVEEEIIDKVCEPYFSTKKDKNGTGLGLYMSKIIIEEHHGGTLHVENKKDGVCFRMNLPLKGTK